MQVTDPVCGMTIDEKGAAGSSEYNGKTYYFCSEDCKKEFDADPAEYVGAEDMEDSVYSCPMHPEISQDSPGKCSRCGMTLRKQVTQHQ